MNETLVKRIKSLIWRGAMMALAVFVGFLAENIVGLGLYPFLTVTLGLVLGEISKYLNTPSYR